MRTVVLVSTILTLYGVPGGLDAQNRNRVENPVLLGVVTGPAKQGVQVLHVLAKSPAAEAGIEPGDLILQIGDTQISERHHVDSALRSVAAGTKVPVRIQRKKKNATAQIEVIARQSYRGDFLRRTPRGKTGVPAPEWLTHSWINLPKGAKPLTVAASRGKVVVIHAFQGW